jgi:hypothetical protein
MFQYDEICLMKLPEDGPKHKPKHVAVIKYNQRKNYV